MSVDILHLQVIQRLLLRAMHQDNAFREQQQQVQEEYETALRTYQASLMEIRESLMEEDWPDNKVENVPTYSSMVSELGPPPVKPSLPYPGNVHHTKLMEEVQVASPHIARDFEAYGIVWHRMSEACVCIQAILDMYRFSVVKKDW